MAAENKPLIDFRGMINTGRALPESADLAGYASSTGWAREYRRWQVPDGFTTRAIRMPIPGDDATNRFCIDVIQSHPRLGESRLKHIVAVVDTSGSMHATDFDEGRLARVQRVMGQILPEIYFGDIPASLITFDSSPHRLAVGKPWEEVLAQVKRQRPGGGTNIPAAIRETLELLTEQEHGYRSLVVLATDGDTNGWFSHQAMQDQAIGLRDMNAGFAILGVGSDYRMETTERLCTGMTTWGVIPGEENRVLGLFTGFVKSLATEPHFMRIRLQGVDAYESDSLQSVSVLPLKVGLEPDYREKGIHLGYLPFARVLGYAPRRVLDEITFSVQYLNQPNGQVVIEESLKFDDTITVEDQNFLNRFFLRKEVADAFQAILPQQSSEIRGVPMPRGRKNIVADYTALLDRVTNGEVSAYFGDEVKKTGAELRAFLQSHPGIDPKEVVQGVQSARGAVRTRGSNRPRNYNRPPGDEIFQFHALNRAFGNALEQELVSG